MKGVFVAALLIAAVPPAAMAQTAAPARGEQPGFEQWHGVWEGSGTVFGRPSTATADFAPALDGMAMRFDYDLTMGGSAPQRFMGHGLYRLDAKGRITGQWSDVSGALHQLKGQWARREWTVVWGSPLTEIGRSLYALTDDGGLHVTDSTLQGDGSWRIFADMRYPRKGG